ncbi:MAG: thiol reductase thioredoxin [Candidatus Glassbacteria bacterium RIFCSPLOWO2_12_FULL_58_11]|uniref:Thiol reductase thioredoxin n=1 Tax=Candidatus Glassbacteria bacterium RIFCSPLOWO2_12_FULL_58_11 TaxID=1817867 RepID=A0A1F5YXA0_9BACT|nr:MAG: thiol reductase thioredoxin [Candidatus Glassbacteria bacterium RIFCSPLOWO2_12_FULL_58_11]
MSKRARFIILAVILLAVAGTLALKQRGRSSEESSAAPAAGLPHLGDLGADKCIPCKMMAPVLEELKEKYKGRLEVTFIDVWKDPAPGTKYGIRVIPTQIFIGPDGKELYRHEGFFSKEDILAKWHELGFTLGG